MDTLKEYSELYMQYPQPVFLVQDGIVVFANHNAVSRGIEKGTKVASLISTGMQEYTNFAEGRLLLTVFVNTVTYNAVVKKQAEYQVFHLEPQTTQPELQVLALASQKLREPLANAMLALETLSPGITPEQKDSLSLLRRSMYQALRSLRNMSDSTNCHSAYTTNLQLMDANAVVSEIVEKAAAYLAQASRTVHYHPLTETVFCQIDRNKIERGILNLISNAARYSSAESPVDITLRSGVEKLYICVESQCEKGEQVLAGTLFTGFQREPSLETKESGIGLGLTIAHGIATAHKGALLVEHKEDLLRFTLSLSRAQTDHVRLNAPAILYSDQAGGYDQALVELSDVLPAALYE